MKPARRTSAARTPRAITSVSNPNIISELKRRKVFKVGAAYLVVAWLAVQAASIGFPAFDAPPWALRVFILLSLLGFPLALVMAWVFDATPEGMKLDTRGTGRARVFAAAAVLIGKKKGTEAIKAALIPSAPFFSLTFSARTDYRLMMIGSFATASVWLILDV